MNREFCGHPVENPTPVPVLVELPFRGWNKADNLLKLHSRKSPVYSTPGVKASMLYWSLMCRSYMLHVLLLGRQKNKTQFMVFYFLFVTVMLYSRLWSFERYI